MRIRAFNLVPGAVFLDHLNDVDEHHYVVVEVTRNCDSESIIVKTVCDDGDVVNIESRNFNEVVTLIGLDPSILESDTPNWEDRGV